jgi:cytoskeletal protein CcmA (bactofilin family)
MWKNEERKPQGIPERPSTPSAHVNQPGFGNAPSSPAFTPPASTPLASRPTPVAPRGNASIGQGIRIKGEVTGSEDLYMDGVIDGKLNLTNGSLTIGPNGTVKADVNAREVIVHGRIDGKVTGRDKVQLMSTCHVTGEVQTERLAIEEGALLRGKVEAGRLAPKAEAKSAAATSSSKSAEALPTTSGSSAD